MPMVIGYVEQAFMEPVGGAGRAKKIACHVFLMDRNGNRINDADCYTDDPRVEAAVFCALSRAFQGNTAEKLAVEVTFEQVDVDRIITRFDVKRDLKRI